MSPVSKGIQFKENSMEEGLNERSPGGCWVSLGSVVSSGKDCEERVCFGKYDPPCTLGAAMGQNPSGMCHNNSTNTLPGAVLKDKDGAVGV
jgi:hypothetical protein